MLPLANIYRYIMKRFPCYRHQHHQIAGFHNQSLAAFPNAVAAAAFLGLAWHSNPTAAATALDTSHHRPSEAPAFEKEEEKATEIRKPFPLTAANNNNILDCSRDKLHNIQQLHHPAVLNHQLSPAESVKSSGSN